MSITCGFFDSLNGDRKYNAEQLSSIFDGIITDGVFPNIGHGLRVKTTNSMMVAIDTGRAWFDHIWIKNDSEHFLTIDAPDLRFNRIDSIFLVVDHRESTRNAYFTVVKGTPTLNPEIPSTIQEYKLSYHRLANITVRANCEYISDGDISSRIGSYECPYIVGAVQTITNDEINSEWDRRLTIWFEQFSKNADDFMTTEQTDFKNWTATEKEDFITWFNGLKYILDGDVAGKIENQISELEGDISSLDESIKEVENNFNQQLNIIDSKLLGHDTHIGILENETRNLKTTVNEHSDKIRKVENLCGENLLVNLGNLKMAEAAPKFDDLPIMPLGVYSQSNFTWNKTDGYISPRFSQNSPEAWINLSYSSKGDYISNCIFQMRVEIGGRVMTFDNIKNNSTITLVETPLVRARVYFNKKFISYPTLVDSYGTVALSVIWNGINPVPDIGFVGFKLERGSTGTDFPIIDTSAEILARVKDMMDGHSVVYHVGDVITLSNADQCWSGFLTSDATDILFFIPFGKVIGEDVSSVVIEGQFQVRGTTGYLNNNISSSSIWYFDGRNESISNVTYKVSTNGVMIKVTFAGKLGGVVNNTPISVVNSGVVKIRFV